MEIATSNRRASEAVALSREPWAVEIRRRLGDKERMLVAMGPASTSLYSRDTDAAAHSPELVRMAKAYGDRAMATCLAMHIADAVMTIADDDTPALDEADAYRAAELMETDSHLRQLPIGMIAAFFHRAKCRRYKIYGKHVTPMKLLECLQQQLPSLMAEAARARQEAEREAARKADEEHRRDAVDWDTYRRMRRITGASPVEFLTGGYGE